MSEWGTGGWAHFTGVIVQSAPRRAVLLSDPAARNLTCCLPPLALCRRPPCLPLPHSLPSSLPLPALPAPAPPPCSTLRFACRAKRVVNNATVNEVLSDAAVLKRQAHEIEELRKMLEGTG